MAIALVDCNSFFASCEIAFRPDLERQPVVVLSNNDGCIIARNQYAKALNIPMGYPYFKIEKYLKQFKVHVFSSNYQLYTDMSDRIVESLRTMAPTVEPYSIDEAFVSLADLKHLPLEAFGAQMRQQIWRDTHLPVSIGIAPTKVLAKIANHLAKKYPQANGVIDLMDAKRHDKALKLIPIEDIWGIRTGRSKRLHALGISNALELRNYRNTRLIEQLLTKAGAIIQQELRGVSLLPVLEQYEPKKMISSSRSFTPGLSTSEAVRQAVARFTSLAVEKLRKQHSTAQGIYVGIRTNRYAQTKSYRNGLMTSLPMPSSDTRIFIQYALQLLEHIYQPGYHYKKISVGLSYIHNEAIQQLDLFRVGDPLGAKELMATMDQINKRYGPETLKSAALSTAPQWKTRMEFLSPRYTTSWNDIPKVSL